MCKNQILIIILIFNVVNKNFSMSGTLDTTFNAAGVQPGTVSTRIDSTGTSNFARSVALQTDGKIVVAGSATVSGVTKFALARFNTDGTIDSTFNAAGVQPGTVATVIESTGTSNFGRSVALQTDGKIVAVGQAFISGQIKLAVARFNTDGTLDTTFNSAGVQPGTTSTRIDSTGTNNIGNSVALQTDGKIVVAGVVTISGITRFAVARFNIDGTIDTTFNVAGVQPGTVSTVIDSTATANSAASVALQTDGKIVAAGSTTVSGVQRLAVARFNTDGTLDTTFNAAGVQPGAVSTVIDSTGINNSASGVAIQTDGKIVAVGRTSIGGVQRFAVARFNTDGTLDTTFNSAGAQPGTTSTRIDSTGTVNSANGVIIQSNGKIIAAGSTSVSGITRFAVARFNIDGTIDSIFNAAGVQPGTVSTVIDSTGTSNSASGVAIQSNGKIVAAGVTTLSGVQKFALARFNNNIIYDPFALRLIEKYNARLNA